MNIYEGNSKAWDLLIIIFTDIPFGLVRQCDESEHDSCKAFIDKYEVSEEKQESFNEGTNRWKNCKTKEKILDPAIWFNELYNLNLKFNNIKSKYEND